MTWQGVMWAYCVYPNRVCFSECFHAKPSPPIPCLSRLSPAFPGTITGKFFCRKLSRPAEGNSIIRHVVDEREREPSVWALQWSWQHCVKLGQAGLSRAELSRAELSRREGRCGGHGGSGEDEVPTARRTELNAANTGQIMLNTIEPSISNLLNLPP